LRRKIQSKMPTPINLFTTGSLNATALVQGTLTSHNFLDFLAFLGHMTVQQIEVVALGTKPEPNPAGHGEEGPSTTGHLFGPGMGDAHRWVWPAPEGFAFGQDKSAPMAVQVMHSQPGVEADRSPWLSLESVPDWILKNPPKFTNATNAINALAQASALAAAPADAAVADEPEPKPTVQAFL
jgi:hypothetical protein